ncbi:MAG: SWIM zinc finger family protein [Actinomycetaceae bacterium]|nr:SWIM zinc finger family protein [Actinomycetaceae bacterium]
MRTFHGTSLLDDAKLALELAPALTPEGLEERPEFFAGFSAQPAILAKGLLAVADVAQTRYFQPMPVSVRDPICTANGDRLRFEAYSACNTVAVRLDLLAGAFDGGDIRHGTTNVDINPPLRDALTRMTPADLLHLQVGADELRLSTLEDTHVERKVELPERWLKALGSEQELTHGLELIGEASAVHTRQFLASLPAGNSRKGQWAISRLGVKNALRPGKGSVYAEGVHRLRAARRLAPHITGMRVYGQPGADKCASVWEFSLPHGRISFTLTPEHYRGFSGEGALLRKLASSTALNDGASVAMCLTFEPRINVEEIARTTGLNVQRVGEGLAVLASDGRVGFDLFEGAYFHRELPSDAARIEKTNPRLKNARRLIEQGAVRPFDGHPGVFRVQGESNDYIVRTNPSSCTCPWWREHQGSRGVCKHVLAVEILTSSESQSDPGLVDSETTDTGN